jgi:hemerythrin
MANELITWNDDFLIGNETIDSQHKELVKLTNEFYAGVQMGGVLAKVYFLQTIQGAVQYVKTHFAAEEDIMKKIKVPNFKEHKKKHEEFIAEVTREIKIFEKNDNPDPAGFVKYLMDWILQHVAESDKKITPYLRKLNPEN